MSHPYSKDTFISYVPAGDVDLYPTEDGKPMAASDYHLKLLIWTLQALEAHFAPESEVYISGDIMMYYREGDPRKSISPDVLVCFGINPKMRLTYKTWEEGKAPDFVMEFSSESTYKKDLNEKMDIYASLEIQDYFLYDAEGLYLPSPLMGFTLVDGAYEAISPDDDDGGIQSSVLGLDFRLEGPEIRIFDPIADDWVRTFAEQESARAEQEAARAEQESARAEQEAARAEQESARAEQEAARAEQESARAENAEAEVALLREELARLKTSS